MASSSSYSFSWSSSRVQPKRFSGRWNHISNTGNSFSNHGGTFLTSFLYLMLFSKKVQIFSWQFSMLYTVRILLSVQPQRSRRYSSALLTRCSQTLGMMTVPSHSWESSMQLLISSMISTIQIFSVEMMLRMLVLMIASFSKIFMFLKSIAFCFLYPVYSSRFSKHRFSPLSMMSLSSQTITLSQVQNSEMLISSWLNMLFSSSSSFSRNWALLEEISSMQGGQTFSTLNGVLLRLMQQRQSKKEMFLKVLLMELLNSARMPSSIVLSSLQRRLSASGFSCSQRKKINWEARSSCAWKMMLSLRRGKSWQRSLIGNFSGTRVQLNCTSSSETWTSGACF